MSTVTSKSTDRSLTTRAGSGRWVGLFAAAAAITIAVTRVYLFATGYPSIGGGTFHLAHALWGGLLLMVSTVLLLAYANERVEPWSALLGGIGAGLFVDEVGKFITRKNDYFFALAAPLAYLCLLGLAAAAYRLGQVRRSTPRARLYAALELSRSGLDGSIRRPRLAALRNQLDAIGPDACPAELALRDGLARYADVLASSPVAPPTRTERMIAGFEDAERRAVPLDRFRRVLRAVLLVCGVLAVIGGALNVGPGVVGLFDRATAAELLDETSVTTLRVVLTLLAGLATLVAAVCYLWSARLLRGSHANGAKASRLALAGVITSLVFVDTIESYSAQFIVLASFAVNLVLAAAIARYRSRVDRESAAV